MFKWTKNQNRKSVASGAPITSDIEEGKPDGSDMQQSEYQSHHHDQQKLQSTNLGSAPNSTKKNANQKKNALRNFGNEQFYDLVQAKDLKKIQDEEVFDSKDLKVIEQYLQPFSLKDFRTDIYTESIFDKKKYKERKEQRMQRQQKMFQFGAPLHNMQQLAEMLPANKFRFMHKHQGSSSAQQELQQFQKEFEQLTPQQQQQILIQAQNSSGEHGIKKLFTEKGNKLFNNKVTHGFTHGLEKLNEKTVGKLNEVSFVNNMHQKWQTGRDKLKNVAKTNLGYFQTNVENFGDAVTQGVGRIGGKFFNMLDDVSSDEDEEHAQSHNHVSVEEQEARVRRYHMRLIREGTEQNNLLKVFKKEIARELIEEVYEHYPLFINTSKEIAKMESEIFELEKLWNEMKSSFNACTEMKETRLQNAQSSNIGSGYSNRLSHSFDSQDEDKFGEESLHSSGPLSGSFKNRAKANQNSIVTSSDQLFSSLLPDMHNIIQDVQEINNEMIQYCYTKNFEQAVALYHEGEPLLKQYFHLQEQIREQESNFPRKNLIHDGLEDKKFKNSFGYSVIETFQNCVNNLKESLLEELRKPLYKFPTSTIKIQKSDIMHQDKQNDDPIVRNNEFRQKNHEQFNQHTGSQNRNKIKELGDIQSIHHGNQYIPGYHQYVQKTAKLINYLVNDFQLTGKAAKAYLDSRTEQLQYSLMLLSSRSIGDPLVYCKYLCELFFEETISNACDMFHDLFKDFNSNKQVSSALMKWVVKQLELFCDYMHSRLFETKEDVELSLASEAFSICLKYSSKLSQKGILVSYLLHDSFRRYLELAVNTFITKSLEQLEKDVSTESWNGSPKRITLTSNSIEVKEHKGSISQQNTSVKSSSTKSGGNNSSSSSSSNSSRHFHPKSSNTEEKKEVSVQFLTSSGVKLYRMINTYLKLTYPIASNQLYRTCVMGLIKLVEEYLITVYRLVGNTYLNDAQFFAMMCNIQSIIYSLIDTCGKLLKRIFNGKEIPEMQRLTAKTQDFDVTVIHAYCNVRSLIIFDRLSFHQPDIYPKKIEHENQLTVSLAFQQFVIHLLKVWRMMNAGYFDHFLGNKETVLSNLLEKVIGLINDRDCEFWIRLGVGLPDIDNVDNVQNDSQQNNKSSDDNITEATDDEEDNDDDDEENDDDTKETTTKESNEMKKESTKEPEEMEATPLVSTFEKFSPLQIQQVLVDIFFIKKMCKHFLSDKSKNMIAEIVKDVVQMCSMSHGTEEEEILKDEEYYKEFARNAVSGSRDLVEVREEFKKLKISNVD